MFSTPDDAVFKQGSNFYIVPNEYGTREAIEQLRGTEVDLFVGVIGGVDVVLNYLAALKPKRAALIDINPKASHYFDARAKSIISTNSFEESLSYLRFSDCLEEVVRIHELNISLPRFKERVVRRIREFRERSDFSWADYYDELKQVLIDADVNASIGDILKEAKGIANYAEGVSTVIYVSNILEWHENAKRAKELEQAFANHQNVVGIKDVKGKNVVVR